ncbi:MAG TPA: response regulator [Candidatus Bathyarchaeota archaeon]|nr:response regulator [Candidatus Bathyarchaeota archaeon]
MSTVDRVLIVDDDAFLRETLVQLLELEGYHVEEACTGEEALVKIQAAFYHLVVIDVKLPDCSGVEILSSVKRLSPRTKKILITGFPDLESAISSVNERADAYIVKPFDPSHLIRKVRELLFEQKRELQFTQKRLLEYIQNRVKELESSLGGMG